MLSKPTRSIVICALGTFLEWTEYSIYGYLAAKISALFFPQVDPRVALLATYGVFATGFFARPIGGIIFGHIGDRWGRKQALTFSMALMGLATFSMGILPTYSQWGLIAPALLLLCRILQGLAVSGEFNGAAIFLIEHADNHHKNSAGSWIGSAAAAGMLCGALMVSAISHEGLPNWSWRIPFWIGSLSCLIGLYLRRKLNESPEFLRHQNEKLRAPLITTFKIGKKSMLQTAAIAAFVGINVYVCNIYFTTFLITHLKISGQTAIMIAAFGQGCVALFIPIFGKMADKWNCGRALILSGLSGAAISATVIFILIANHTITLLLLAQLLYAIFNGMSSGPLFNHLNTLFPAQRRYTGITVAWSISVAIFGGTAPMISQYLVGTLEWHYGPAIYVVLSAVMAILAIISLPISAKDQKRRFVHQVE